MHARRREGWIEVEDDGADDLVDELFGVDERAVEVEDDDAGHGVREAPRDGGERARERLDGMIGDGCRGNVD